jgi:hypothetical protein
VHSRRPAAPGARRDSSPLARQLLAVRRRRPVRRTAASSRQPAGGRRFRAHARRADLREVTLQGRHVRFGPVSLRDWQRVRLDRIYPGTAVKEAVDTILVPRPTTRRSRGNAESRPGAAEVGPWRRRFRPAGGTGVSDQQREHEHGDSRSNALIIGSVVAAGQRQPLIDVGHQLGVPLADPGPLGVIVSLGRVEFGLGPAQSFAWPSPSIRVWTWGA